MNKRCKCIDIPFGSYKSVVSMKTPQDKWVGIDICIASEIGYLWNQGVETLNSCCGHNKLVPSVIVEKDSIETMKRLGYKKCELKSVVPEQTFELKLNSEIEDIISEYMKALGDEKLSEEVWKKIADVNGKYLN